MDDEAVRELEGELGQVLVGAVDGVPGLEARHAPPAALGDRARAARAGSGGGGRRAGPREGAGRCTGPPASVAGPREQVGHARVRRVLGAVDVARLLEGIALEDLAAPRSRPRAGPRRRAGPPPRRAATERARLVVHGQGEGQGPHRAVGQPQVLDHARVVGRAQEAGEGARRAGGDQLEVGELARVEGERRAGCRPGAGAPPPRAGGTMRSTSTPPWGGTGRSGASWDMRL